MPYYHFSRQNPMGLNFSFFEEPDKKTRVVHAGKIVIFDMEIHQVSQCYYEWQMRRVPIQDAFRELPAEHREFLMTGITPEEWNQIFSEVEE